MTLWPEELTYQPIAEWPREHTRERGDSPFSTTLTKTLRELQRELRAIGAKDPFLQIALHRSQFTKAGTPYARAVPEHPGVILTLTTENGTLQFPSDKYDDWQENLRAIVLTMEALRLIDRYGVSQSGEQYTGWEALEAGPAGKAAASAAAEPNGFTGEKDALDYLRNVAGIEPGGADTRTPAGVARVAKAAQRKSHPDAEGGDADTFARVSRAVVLLRALGKL